MVTTKDKTTSVEVIFAFKNATPGAFRYDEVDANGTILKGDNDGAVIGTLYLRKAGMKGKEMKKFKCVLTEILE